jgi:capsular polysaccharide biosynthesis protein
MTEPARQPATRAGNAMAGTMRLLRSEPRQRAPHLLVIIATVLALVAAIAGYEVVKRGTPTFRAQAVISLDQPLKIASSTSSGEIDKLARLRATYLGVVKFDSVAQAVGKEVKLTRGQVRARVFAEADPSSLLLIVGANDRTGTSARRLATALANEVVVYIQQQQDRAKVPDLDRITATIVVAPSGATQTAPTSRKAYTTAIVAAVLAFLLVIGLGLFLRRPTS